MLSPRDGARDRAPRGDPRGPGAPGRAGEPRRVRRVQRSADGRDGARPFQDRAGELLARAGTGGRRRRRRHFVARGLRSVRRRALPHRDGPQRRTAPARQQRRRPALPRLPLLASRHARPAEDRARQRAPVHRAGRRRARQGQLSRARWTACPTAKTRAKAMCAAGASCIRGSPSRSRRRTASRWRTPRRPCSACATAATWRCASTWCACRPSRRSAQYLASGWIENVDEKSIEEFDINGLPTATALAKGDQWTFRLYAIRFGSDVYRFIFAAKQMTPGGRPRVPLFGRDVPPHDAERDRSGAAVAAAHRDGARPATPPSAWPAACRWSTARSSAS